MKLLTNNKKRFEKICRANQLTIDAESNAEHLFLLESIFENREYADYFPFYEKAVIVDIGAHVGYFSLFASINSGIGSRIIAVEPDKKNFMMLGKNILDAKRSNIETANVAVSDHDGEVNLHHGNSVNHSLIANYELNKKQDNYTTVKSMSLPSLFSHFKLEKIDFLKIDCEGAEYAIILNAPTGTFRNVYTISMEFHDLKNERYTGNTLCKKLAGEGFQIAKFNHEPTTMGLNFGKIIATRSW